MFNPLAAPDSVPGALYKPGPDDEFSFIGISHCWEAREHPDPFGYQPLELSSTLSGRSGCFLNQFNFIAWTARKLRTI